MKLTVFQKLFCFSSFQYADSLRQGQMSTHSLWSTANRNVKHSTRSEPNYNDNDVVQRPFSAHSRPAYLILISPLACTCKYADKTNMSCLSFLRAQAICCRCCTAGFSGRCWITARRRSTVALRSTIVDVPTTISATVLYIHGVQNYSMHVLLRNCGRPLHYAEKLLYSVLGLSGWFS